MKKFLCCVFAVLVFCLPFFSFQSIESKADIDNISATVADYDIENYPTANYFDVTAFRPYSQPNTNSITAVSNGLVNAIIISSTTDANSSASENGYTVTNVKLGQACPYLQVGETYTLSAESESVVKLFYLNNRLGNSVSWDFGTSLTITADYLDSYIVMYGFAIGFGQTAGDCRISKIMINRGEVAYPYSPYFYNIYDSGYGSGQVYGYNDGYNIGFNDGVSSVNNFWETTSISLYGYNNYSSAVKIADLTSSFNTYGISTNGYPSTVSTYDFYRVVFTFDEPKSANDIGFFDSSFYVSLSKPIPVTSDNDINYTNPLFYVAFSNYTGNFPNANAQLLGFTLNPYIIQGGTSVRLYHNVWTDINYNSVDGKNNLNTSFTISTSNYDFIKNIAVGRNNEIAASYNQAYVSGKNDGYREGKKQASEESYQLGFQSGLKSSQGFYGLLTAVFDVPVQAFTGLLNFNVLGVNMVDFVTSMLTLCIFIIILRLFI